MEYSTCRKRGTKLVLTYLVFRNLYCIAPLGRSGNGPLPLRKVFESGDLRPFDAKACVSQKPREFMGPEKEASRKAICKNMNQSFYDTVVLHVFKTGP